MCLISLEVEHKVLHRQWTGASTHKQFTFLQMKWNEMKFIIIIHKTQISEALFWALSIALIGCRIWADHDNLLISSISFFIIPTFYHTVCGAF